VNDMRPDPQRGSGCGPASVMAHSTSVAGGAEQLLCARQACRDRRGDEIIRR
jgi:hypothetical protein